MAKPNDSDIVLLINYIQSAPRRMQSVPGKRDMESVDEYRIIVTSEQREWLADALRSYNPR